MAFDSEPWLLDGTTVDAEVIRRALGTLVGSAGGIVTAGDLTITQNGTPNMSVNVGTGQIWVPGSSTSSQGPYYGRNAASVNVSINAANGSNPRIDTIVVQVEDPAYGGSGTPMAPKAIAGTATAGANLTNLTGKASVPASAYVLGYVLVPANATTIVTADIANVASVAGSSGSVVSNSMAYFPNDTASFVQIGGVELQMTCRGVPIVVMAGPFQVQLSSAPVYSCIFGVSIDSGTPTPAGTVTLGTDDSEGCVKPITPMAVVTPTAGTHYFSLQQRLDTAASVAFPTYQPMLVAYEI